MATKFHNLRRDVEPPKEEEKKKKKLQAVNRMGKPLNELVNKINGSV